MLKQPFRRILTSRLGASQLDFGMIVGLVAVISIGTVAATGGKIFDIFSGSASELSVAGKANENASDKGKENSAKAAIEEIIVPEDGEYGPGSSLEFTVVFDKKVNVKENTYIEIDVGGEIRKAYYKSGSKTNEIVFEYIVTEEDIDEDGIDFGQPGTGADDGSDGVSGEDGGEADGDFSGQEPDMGGVVLPGPQECEDACLYVAMKDGRVMLVGADGAPIWTNDDQAEEIIDLAVDDSGAVYTAGADGTVRKIRPSGMEEWSHVTGFDIMRAVAVAEDGRVYAGSGTGMVLQIDGTTGQAMSAEPVRTTNADQIQRDAIEGITIDKDGFPIVTSIYGALAKLDPSGDMNVLWQEEMPSDQLEEVHVDSSGNIYTGGFTWNYSEPDYYSDDAVYVVSDNAGSRTLVNRVDEVSGKIFNLDLGPDGTVVVSASNMKARPMEHVVAAYMPGDAFPEKWTYSNFSSYAMGISFDGMGHVYAGGGDKVVKLKVADGSEVSSFSFDGEVREVEAYAPGVDTGPSEGAGTAQGEACTANCVYASTVDGRVMSLDQDGSIIWTNSDQTDTVYALELGPNGNIHTAGEDGTVRKIGPDGAQIWSHNAAVSAMLDVDVADDGTVFAVGMTGMLRKLSAEGNVLATKFIKTTNQSQAGNDWVASVDVGENGMVYVATKYGGVAKVDPAGDMTVLWNMDAPSDYLASVELGPDGRIYVAGQTFDYSQDDMYAADAAYALTDVGNGFTVAEEFDEVNGQVFAMALSPAGKVAVASTKMKTPYVYHVKQFSPGKYYPEDWDFTGQTAHTGSLTYDASGNLWIAGRDMTVRKIDGTTGGELMRTDLDARVYGIAVSD